MSHRCNHNNAPLVKIVYTTVRVGKRTEIVPLELYADGSLKRCA